MGTAHSLYLKVATETAQNRGWQQTTVLKNAGLKLPGLRVLQL